MIGELAYEINVSVFHRSSSIFFYRFYHAASRKINMETSNVAAWCKTIIELHDGRIWIES